ncbi:hypothetical protein [Oceanimonas doudoroffii]|uniref:Uncharacterized protein n=1 Tax=Oceanimonas doudoroffii TaxID=84158 RepID=A0A233RA93_9GAMM|nr:hypothetical protein [Oceanimonas doudoroffii]OXY80316.1 hypothetical protein B6S08_18120 [Oceanimonas doudoroffii]
MNWAILAFQLQEVEVRCDELFLQIVLECHEPEMNHSVTPGMEIREPEISTTVTTPEVTSALNGTGFDGYSTNVYPPFNTTSYPSPPLMQKIAQSKVFWVVVGLVCCLALIYMIYRAVRRCIQSLRGAGHILLVQDTENSHQNPPGNPRYAAGDQSVDLSLAAAGPRLNVASLVRPPIKQEQYALAPIVRHEPTPVSGFVSQQLHTVKQEPPSDGIFGSYSRGASSSEDELFPTCSLRTKKQKKI